ncbi:unnamed protein product [Dovyalis caffra]|uniref:SCP domain-containing protein n=1 Tax=Dovyalis caffra TaxID=77055 RepID=A0AAV1RAY7_9ROSI|nr:unnamed protein product [Dovyalis caffra]
MPYSPFLVLPSHAQNSPQDYLNAHNAARSQVSVANITWDAAVAAYAQNYSNFRTSDCNHVHSAGPYGENLAKGSGSFTGTAAVDLWAAEKPHYDYASNSRGGGQCLHYTQVVWHDSVHVGCARVTNAPMAGGLFLVTMIPQATILGSVLTKESPELPKKMPLLRVYRHR